MHVMQYNEQEVVTPRPFTNTAHYYEPDAQGGAFVPVPKTVETAWGDPSQFTNTDVPEVDILFNQCMDLMGCELPSSVGGEHGAGGLGYYNRTIAINVSSRILISVACNATGA